MKYLSCIIGHAKLLVHVPTPGPMSRPLIAQASQKGAIAMPPTTVPELTTADLERSLRDALTRQFEKKGPTGQVVTEAPLLEEVFPDTKELIYRDAGKYWRAPYLLNADKTASVGVGVAVAKTWTALSAVQRRDLEREVMAYFHPLKAAGDRDPVVKEVRAKDAEKGSVVALFAGAYYELPFLFEGPKCWVSSPRPMERDGATATFRAPSNMSGLDVVALTDKIVGAMKDLGRPVSFADAQIIAAKVCAAPPKADLGRFLTELFNASKRGDGKR